MTESEAFIYCKQLATSHYENFHVASFFLPKPLRQPFYIVYAYCRCSDDLADEHDGSPQSRQRAWQRLNDWQQQLDQCFRQEGFGQADFGQTAPDTMPNKGTHPVFIALRWLIRHYALPKEPFADLLVAFRQDQTQQGYATFEELLGYCRYSANPVGRIVLHLIGNPHSCNTYNRPRVLDSAPSINNQSINNQSTNKHFPLLHSLRQSWRTLRLHPLFFNRKERKDFTKRNVHLLTRHNIGSGIPTPEQLSWSDSICTALQLANFWQDVRRDKAAGRCYIPQDVAQKFGVDLTDLHDSPEFRRMIQELVADARSRFHAGKSLVETVPKKLRKDISLFIRGGLAILDAIERIQFNVLEERPALSRWIKLRLLLGLGNPFS